MKVSSYLVCHEILSEVAEFLEQFLVKLETKYTHSEWITFKTQEFRY